MTQVSNPGPSWPSCFCFEVAFGKSVLLCIFIWPKCLAKTTVVKTDSIKQHLFIHYMNAESMLHAYAAQIVFSSTGHRPARLCHGLLSAVCPFVCALTFSLNIFSETTHQILIKFHRNVPAMVLFRIS